MYWNDSNDECQFKTAKRPQAPSDTTVRKRFFCDNLVIFRRRSKRIAFLESVNFFYVCLYANFQFSWWSRDHSLAPFRGLYLPNALSQILQTSKRHTSRVSVFHRYLFPKNNIFSAFLGYLSVTLKMRKNAVLDLALPTLQNSRIFHDTTRSHFHSWRFAAEITAIRGLYTGLRVGYKYYNSRFGSVCICPNAGRDLSRPTSVFRTTIGVCKILSRSVEIWQYEGQKPVFE